MTDMRQAIKILKEQAKAGEDSTALAVIGLQRLSELPCATEFLDLFYKIFITQVYDNHDSDRYYELRESVYELMLKNMQVVKS